jgi:predicted NAD-dependent protein-ADP-ribosyltransferase YbiA (DUF1768 family)
VADPEAYRALAAIPNWRKVLSNFHAFPFEYKGRTYRTIEHAFQAAKIALVSPERAEEFTVESGTPLGLGDGLTARRARKMVVLDKPTIARWGAMSRHVMAEASIAKYAACSEARHVLEATGQAQLWHVVMRSKFHDHFTHLEHIRARMQVNYVRYTP